ncbi:hypothetical protein F2Q68_00007046 [Brassica cretica]|uniref:Secreted protein n=1 Tax=Brassica cretica TaxID=69181 RepID=A0A8S9KV53_BRACR|nr:hypothetical protein F2Q68_00007046 [Brassica cretica]
MARLRRAFLNFLCLYNTSLSVCVVFPRTFEIAVSINWSTASGGRRRVSIRRSPPTEGLYPSVAADGGSLSVGRHPCLPCVQPSPSPVTTMPLPPCFIYYVLRRVAAGSGVLNRSLWASTASPE